MTLQKEPPPGSSFFFFLMIKKTKNMSEYLFNFDIHDADSDVYREIEQRLETSGCRVLGHPLGSTYHIRAGEENVKNLCGDLKNAFSDLSMAFILSRLDREKCCKSETKMRKLVRLVMEEIEKKLREEIVD